MKTGQELKNIKMTAQERYKLKVAMSTFRSTKRNFPKLHAQLRDAMIKTMVKSETPDWNSLRFTITKQGV